MNYKIVNFSGGKDSTAMLLRLIELDIPFDEIVFCDTGLEFPQMYDHINKVEEYIKRPITRLKAEHSFEHYLLHHKYKGRYGKNKGKRIKGGYQFPYINSRWCTELLKIEPLRNHCQTIAPDRPIIKFIGIAADEPKRIHDEIYPLVKWGWTEKDCLEYCKKHGFDWGGMYQERNRLSCWVCPLQTIQSWRLLRKEFPDLWEKLLYWQSQKTSKLTPRFSAFDLETRFKLEEEWTRQGKSITSHEFHRTLKRTIWNTRNA